MVGTPEEYIERMRNQAEMTAMQRQIIGSSTRFELPTRDRFLLRKAVDRLQGALAHIQTMAHNKDMGDMAIFLGVKAEAQAYRKDMEEMTAAHKTLRVVDK